MDYIKVILTSLFSLAALFLLTKLVGAKQVSELSMFDYINGISIGSIAAEMATELEQPLKPLVAMLIYGFAAAFVSFLTAKSVRLRRIFFGKSVVLMENGRLYRENFKKTHLDLNEFLMQCRSNGYFDISAINTAVLEPSGKISILPFPEKRPATPEDLNVIPQSEGIFFSVIMEGKIIRQNLSSAGRNEAWLTKELKKQGLGSCAEVYFAALAASGSLKVFPYNTEKIKNDYFE